MLRSKQQMFLSISFRVAMALLKGLNLHVHTSWGLRGVRLILLCSFKDPKTNAFVGVGNSSWGSTPPVVRGCQNHVWVLEGLGATRIGTTPKQTFGMVRWSPNPRISFAPGGFAATAGPGGSTGGNRPSCFDKL